MIHPLKQYKKDLDEALQKNYYHPTCDFCHNELILSLDSAEFIMFEPKEIEEEVDVFDIDEQTHKVSKTYKKKVKRSVSSDPSKDFYRFKCPYCGHICEVPAHELYKLGCSYYGDNLIRFTLDEVETERAREFKKEHNHCAEFIEENKLAFTTLGQQFTYEITPGGFGNGITIRCNKCKQRKNITNIDNW